MEVSGRGVGANGSADEPPQAADAASCCTCAVFSKASVARKRLWTLA